MYEEVTSLRSLALTQTHLSTNKLQIESKMPQSKRYMLLPFITTHWLPTHIQSSDVPTVVFSDLFTTKHHSSSRKPKKSKNPTAFKLWFSSDSASVENLMFVV